MFKLNSTTCFAIIVAAVLPGVVFASVTIGSILDYFSSQRSEPFLPLLVGMACAGVLLGYG